MRCCRRWFWPFVVVAGLLVAWQVVAESVEPYRALPLLDALRGTRPPLEAPAVGRTALRLYADARPRVGKIAGLQKGLVWVDGGRELVEEGYGLGCPIIEIDGQAFLSRQATVAEERRGDGLVWIKRFTMDTIDTPIRLLRRKYRPVQPIGEVVFSYTLRAEGVIDVEVDFSGLQRPWTRAYLMNEQGARTFVLYEDDLGGRAEGDGLGPWQRSEAERACLASGDGRLRFCVERPDGATLYWGRERYLQYNWRGTFYLSWSGLDLAVDARPVFRYRLRVSAD